ncbi:MAG: hypothetical protein ACJ8GN_28390 [Longimicrobiaceae bacterium]
MWRYLLHLWALPPIDARIEPCPPPRAGEAPDPFGFYDALRVQDVWSTIFWISLIGTLVIVLACYLVPRASLSARFVKGWYACLVGTMLFCFAVPYVVGMLSPVTARAGSCTTRPAAYLIPHLPFDLLFPRMLAGALWGLVAYIVFSVFFTQILARGAGPVAGGFFHYRGCPWPRWNPLEG